MLSITILKIFIIISPFAFLISGSPISPCFRDLERRTAPTFPDTPSSCPICEKDYPTISHCADASPVLANFSMIIYNPGAFIDVIQCACTETFQSVFPQCVDCFVKTGQEDVLNTDNLPGIVDGMRRICALQSTLLGNVSGANGYPTPSPTPTKTSGSLLPGQRNLSLETTLTIFGIALFMGLLGL